MTQVNQKTFRKIVFDGPDKNADSDDNDSQGNNISPL